MKQKVAKKDLCDTCKKVRAQVSVIGVEAQKIVGEQYCNNCWAKQKSKKRKTKND